MASAKACLNFIRVIVGIKLLVCTNLSTDDSIGYNKNRFKCPVLDVTVQAHKGVACFSSAARH